MQLTRPYSSEKIQNWLTEMAGQEIFRPGFEFLQTITKAYQQWINEKKIKVVTIAGTNGKGETAHKLAYLLKVNNISYTLWTSPHIVAMTERFSSQNGDITADFLGELFHSQSHLVKKLSYFEFIFVIFLEYSFRLQPEVIILEVGLGGKLDAANTIESSLTAITSISRDHQEILGNSYEKILRDKWGITRANVPIITSFELSYLRERASLWSEKQNSPWIDLFSSNLLTTHDHFSKRNEVLAKTLFTKLTGKPIGDVNFPSLLGRGDTLYSNQHQFKFLGSHNPDGMRKLIQYLHDRQENFDSIIVSFSKRNHQDLKVMIKILLEAELGNIILTEFEHPKSADLRKIKEELKEEFSELKVEDWKQFIKNLDGLNATSKKILVTGSYYFVGEVKKHFF